MLEILDIQKRYLHFSAEKTNKKDITKNDWNHSEVKKEKRKYFITVVLIYLLTAEKMRKVY